MRKRHLALFVAIASLVATDRSLSDEPAAVGTTPTERMVDFLVARARRYYQKWEQEKAIADLREAVALEPSNVRLHYRLGVVYLAHFQSEDEAITSFTRAYELAKADADRRAAIAPETSADRKLADGGGPVRQCRKKLAAAYISRSFSRSTKGDVAGAHADCDSAVDIDPHSAETRLMRAAILEEHGKHAEALTDYDAAIDIEPKRADLRLERALFLTKRGKYEEALRDCDAAAELDPQSPLPWCSRAYVFQTKGDSAKAIEILDQAIARFPGRVEPYLQRSHVLDDLGESLKALDDLNRAVEMEPEKATWYFIRARVLRKLKRDDEAVADDKKAKDLAAHAASTGTDDPLGFDELEMPDVEVLSGDSGALLGHKVMLATPVVTLRAGPSMDADVATGTMGGLLTLEVTRVARDWLQIDGKWVRRDDVTPLQTAAEFFSRAIGREPTPFAYVSRAVTWLHLREVDKALADAEEAVRLDPEFALAYCTRADARMAQGKYEEALPDLDRALQREPKLVVALGDRALAHRALEDFRAALDDLDAAIALDPSWQASWAASRRSIAESLFEDAQKPRYKADHRQVIADMDKATETVPERRTARFYASRGWEHHMLHEHEKAVADLRKAIEMEPAELKYHSQLGSVYTIHQDFDQAITEYRIAYDLRKAQLAGEAKRRPGIEEPGMPGFLYDRLVAERGAISSAHIGRAGQRATQGDFKGALNDCNAAAELEPNSVYPLCIRATVYEIKGDLAKSVDILNQAILLFPEEAHPISMRAAVWKELGQFRKALDDYNRVIELEPDDASSYSSRADVLRALQRNDEAAADEKKEKELLEKGKELLERAGIK
jgi:tetratricopeptide (TPR) repeat protein